MASYSTVELISRTSWPGGNLAYGGTCTGSAPYPASSAGNLPVGVTLDYEPLVSTEYVYDPTKEQKRNWSEIKESGQISFTPYERSKTVVNNFVVSRRIDFASWKFHQQGCLATMTANRYGPFEGHIVYNRNSSFDEYVSIIESSLVSNMLSAHSDDIADAISTTQQAAFASATSTYDLLTELMEFGETLKFLQSIVGSAAKSLDSFASTDGPTYRRARGLNAKQMLASSNKALQKLGSRWMAYRYAIMPLIYSIKDVNELLGKRTSIYNSGRDMVHLDNEIILGDHDLPVEGLAVVTIGNIKTSVRSLFKTRYDKGALQRILSQVSFNPFLTAWELIPLSFVVDWFLNVGDAIVSATRIDSSTESLGVTAIRSSSLEQTILYDTTVDRSNFSTAAWLNQPALTRSYTHSRNLQAPLREVRVESYKRLLFTRPKPKISFDPYLNWKRILDSLVLSHKPISKLLRSL